MGGKLTKAAAYTLETNSWQVVRPFRGRHRWLLRITAKGWRSDDVAAVYGTADVDQVDPARLGDPTVVAETEIEPKGAVTLVDLQGIATSMLFDAASDMALVGEGRIDVFRERQR